ncbi:MAG: hypothetical protein HY272_03590 [Gammaproteobacteria bacterium]|nr:hypothetical protein [Gammaproteobacteria bacterium]
MKALKKLFAISVLMLSLPVAGHAEGGVIPPSQMKNPWLDCGIGAMIFTETKWAAVTSNVIWDLGTTAVTSGASTPN